MNDGLYVYRGGGYDGCIWEMNAAAVRSGEFFDLHSSGSMGCKTMEALAYKVEHDKGLLGFSSTFELMDLPIPDIYRLKLAKKLCELGIADSKIRCFDCGETKSFTSFLVYETLDQRNLICDACTEEAQCEECMQYTLDTEKFGGIDTGLCTGCFEQELYKFTKRTGRDAEDELEDLEEQKAESLKVYELMLAQGKSKEFYDKQLEQANKETDDKISELFKEVFQ